MGNMAHSKEQNKSLETNVKETQALELPDKGFKITLLKMLNKTKGKHRDQDLKENQENNT